MYRRLRQGVSLLSILAIAVAFSGTRFLLQPIHAANLTLAYIRLDRMKASTATNVMVVFQPTSVSTGVTKVKVTFPGAWTVGGSPSVNTNLLPAGVTALPSPTTLSAAAVGQVVTISNVDSLDTAATYGFNIASSITTGAAGAYTVQIETDVVNTPLDTDNMATRVIDDDQLVISAVVPPTFNFALQANADSFTADLDPSAVVSTHGKTVTVTTNAPHGWTMWVKDLYQGLRSATANKLIPTTGTVNGAPSTLSAGTEGYVLDTDLTTDSATTGTGAVTVDPEYNGADTSSGGTLSANFQPVASADGPTDGDVLTLYLRSAISGITHAAADYTDTLTIVGAGSF